MYEKHRLELPIAKYFTQPRRIGLIFSITPPTGWEREARKISLSLPSKAVRFLPFGNSSGIPRPVWPPPPGAVSPPPPEAIAGAAANPPESPDHRRILRIRLPSTARAGS